MSKPIEPDAILVRAEDVLATVSQDVAVLMSMDTGKFVELNETASAVWDLTDGEASVAQIVDRLGERFDVAPDTCRAQVTALYARMCDEGLVAFAD